jgi:hypothetical protein
LIIPLYEELVLSMKLCQPSSLDESSGHVS